MERVRKHIICGNEDGESTFKLTVYSEKTNLDLYNLNHILEPDYDDLNPNIVYRVDIGLYEVASNRDIIGEVFKSELYLFSDLEDDDDIFNDADSRSQIEIDYVQALFESEEYHRDLLDYDNGDIFIECGKQIISGALHRFYVYPEYRKLGIGEFMLNNLDKILERTLNLKLRCLITYPKPDEGQDANMLDVMIKHITDNGFKMLQFDNNYYIRDYLEEYFE